MCVSIAATDAQHSTTIHLLAEALKACLLLHSGLPFPSCSLHLSLDPYDYMNLVILSGITPEPLHLIVA